jgi:hypothetical protein
MPVKLSKRERILRTIACQETDRVPLYDLLLNDAAIAHFGGEILPERRDDAAARAAYKRITGRAICDMLDMTRSSDFGPLIDRDFIDDDGFEIHESTWGKTSWISKRPFEDLDGARLYLHRLIERTQADTRAIEANPKYYGERFAKDFLENTVGHMGDTVHLITQQGTGLDDILYRLGFQLLSYLMADDPELLSAALEAITCNHIAICHAAADPQLSPVVLTY